MDKNQEININAILEPIRQKITLRSEKILECLAILSRETNQQIISDNIDDITKIKEACLFLQSESQKLLVDGLIPPPSNIVDYLSKTRHDLRNPINIILGYTEILLEEFEQLYPALAASLLEIISIVREILNVVQEIKMSSPQAPVLSKKKNSPPASVVKKDREYTQFKKQLSILIVDDIEENCVILERYLRRIGYVNIEKVYNGSEAITILKEKKFDIILLDVDMPKMNGIEVLIEINEKIIQRQIMVLMVSAADTMENTLECLKLGAEDFLPKPFNSELLQVRMGSCAEKKWFMNKENIYIEKIEMEKGRYEKLLNSIFPQIVVTELAKYGQVETRHYSNVAVLFADIVGFTPYCDSHNLHDIITNLQQFVSLCELAASRNNMQKIKTIGDCFLGVSGMLVRSDNPVLDCINWGEEILAKMSELPSNWQLRVGINFGTILGGIVGTRQYLFDVWGDTVNTASRIQTLAKPNTIFLSKNAWLEVEQVCHGQSLGKLEVKGKAPLEIFTYLNKL